MGKHSIEFIKQENGLSLYIDHSLQFDTRDEHIYHEGLFLPPALISSARNTASINSLVLGGGDGLGLRELLRVPKTRAVDLVDYDPDMVALAQKELSVFNQASFDDARVRVHIDDAWNFIAQGRDLFDCIVSDLTFPDDLSGCRFFTRTFFSQVMKRLTKEGVLAINACSPSHSPEAYWSMYRTLAGVGLYPKPLRFAIPSFSAHGYGDWGFFLASRRPVSYEEVSRLSFPAESRYLLQERLMEAMRFESSSVFHGLCFSHLINKPEDLQALLNMSGIFDPLGGGVIDFSRDIVPLKLWRYFADNPGLLFLSMSSYWKERVLNILVGLDWEAIQRSLEKQLATASEKTALEIRQLLEKIGQCYRDRDFSRMALDRFFVALVAAIIVMNMVCPDNAYAKGYSGSHSSSGGEGVVIALVAPVAATPFYNQYWTSPGYVPNMSAKQYLKAGFPTLLDPSGQKNDPVFFALGDISYLTESGELYLLIPRTSFVMNVQHDRLALYRKDQVTLIAEFGLEGDLAGMLSRDILLHRQNLVKTIEQMERWLGWAGPAGIVVSEISEEQRELVKMKALLVILDRLLKQGEFVAAASVNEPPSSRLMPSLRMTATGEVVIKDVDGIWKSYVGAVSVEGTDIFPASADLDRLVEELLTAFVVGLKPGDPVREMLIQKMGGTIR